MLFELLFSPFVMSVQSCCVGYAVVMSEYGSLGVGFAVRGLGSTGLVLAKMVSLTSPIKLSRSRFRPASSRPCCSSVYCSPSPGLLLLMLPLLVIRRYLGARNGVHISQPPCRSQTQQERLLRRIASSRRHHVQSSPNFYSAPAR